MWKRELVLVGIVLSACGEDAPSGPPAASAEAPVPAGHVRVRRLPDRALPEDNFRQVPWGWSDDWLAIEGWHFLVYEVEAGTPGRATIAWRDPRADAPFAEFSFRVGARPAQLVWGVRTRPLVVGPHHVTCENCGAGFRISGSISECWQCAKCKHDMPLDPDWTSAPGREFRILVSGVRPAFGKAPGLKSRTDGEFSLAVGAIRPRALLVPEDACDVVGLPRGGELTVPAGPHVFARYIGAANASSRKQSRFDSEFEYERGATRIEGSTEGYRILLDGKPVALADYPHPVWEFSIRYDPE